MAVYGLGTPGQVPFTGWTPTLSNGQANLGATSGYVNFNGVQQGDDRLAKMFRNGAMTLATTQILYTLLGQATGQTATKTKKQVQHVTGAPGGLIPIETINLVNRATVTNDLTAFQALVTRNPFPSTYAPDVSGNGGGGHVTY